MAEHGSTAQRMVVEKTQRDKHSPYFPCSNIADLFSLLSSTEGNLHSLKSRDSSHLEQCSIKY